MKHLFTLFSKLLMALVLCQLFFPITAQCQSALEFFSNGMSTTTQGPSITTGAIKVALNTDNPTGNTNNLTYSATPITVTYTLSNQQFGTNTSNYAAVFGANSDGNAPLFIPMNSYGSPTNAMFTSGVVSGKGIDVTNNYTAQLFTRGWQFSGVAANATQRIADLTITFSSPISNPVLHLGGSGGQNGNFGACTEFDLIQVNTGTSGLSWTRLSGNNFFTLSGTSVTNSANRFSANSTNSSPSGISGSVRVNGSNITTIVLRLYLHGDGNGNSSSWSGLGDATDLGVSFPYGQYTIQGTVRNDADISDGIGGSQYYNGSTALYAYLINPSGKLVAVTQVSSTDGTYSFSNQSYPVGGAQYSIVLSTNGTLAVDGTVNAPSATTPLGWLYVGSNTYNASINTTTTTTGNAVVNNLPLPTTSGFGGVTTYQNIDFAVSSVVLDVPTFGAVTQPLCGQTVGTFQITNYNAGYTYSFTPSVVSISSTGLVTANPGSYTATASNGSFTSAASASVTINAAPSATTPVLGSVINVYLNATTPSVMLNNYLTVPTPPTGFHYEWYYLETPPPAGTPHPNTATVPVSQPGYYRAYMVGDVSNTGSCIAGPSDVLTIYNNGLALPVVLQQFNGINQNGAVQLKWSTASEINAQSFEVQRSNDGGKTWSAIGTVNAVGNSTTVQQYSFTDIAPLATNQYRLNMIDADGSSEISKLIVAVNLGQNAALFKVIPNPITGNGHGKILLNAPLETKSELRIVDMAGRTVKTYPVAVGTQTVEFGTDGLAKGIYIVTLLTTNGVQHDKILIN